MTHALKPPAPITAREIELTRMIGNQLADAIRMRRNLVRLGSQCASDSPMIRSGLQCT